MKNLKGLKAVNATATMTPVSIESLRETGVSNNAFRFVPSDVIEIPEELEVYSERFKIGDDELTYYVVKMTVNDEPFMVSVATFRKDRVGVENYVEEYHQKSPISRMLASLANDEERMRYLCGRKLRVLGSFPAREYRFEAHTRVTYNADDPTTYKTRFWPIFEEL